MQTRWLTFAAIGCGGAHAPAPANHGSVAVAAVVDPIACPEVQLRSLAAHFPDATLEIAIVDAKEVDDRGVVELPCELVESDDDCLARGRRGIPAGMSETVFANGAGHIDGDTSWEVTFDVDGKIVVERTPIMMDPVIFPHMHHKLGQRVRFISQREISTPENRKAIIWYGYQRRHRAAKLWFGPAEGDPPPERLFALEEELDLVDQGVNGMVRKGEDWDTAPQTWVAEYTCR